MCELFGLSSAVKIGVNDMLREFFSHGVDHPHGWGLAFFYGNAVSLEKQPEASYKSKYLRQRLRTNIEADKMIAHIRLATRGIMNYDNTHPFVMRDRLDRTWTLAHNGTVFECDALNPFVRQQQGQTDSERILYYIISRMDQAQQQAGRKLSSQERFDLVDEIICQITPENKINLLLYDGELLYVHTNYEGSLFTCKKGGAAVVATTPLDRDDWKAVPVNRLFAYQDGKLSHMGTEHGNEFFDSEEKTRLLFLDFAAL